MSVNTATTISRGPLTQRTNDIYACDTELPPIFNRFDKTRKADQFLSFQSTAESVNAKPRGHGHSGSKDIGRNVSFQDDPRVVRRNVSERQASPTNQKNQASEYYKKIQDAANQVHDTLREYNLTENMMGDGLFMDEEDDGDFDRLPGSQMKRKKDGEKYDPRVRIMSVIEDFFQKDHDLVLSLSQFATEAMATQPAQEKRLALVESIVNDNAEETEANLSELQSIVHSSNKVRENRSQELGEILKNIISYAVQRLNSSMGKRSDGKHEEQGYVSDSQFHDLKLRLQVQEMKCAELQQKLLQANTSKMDVNDMASDASQNHESVDDMRHRQRGSLKEVQRLQEQLVTMSSGDVKTALDRELVLQKKNNSSLEQLIQGLAEEKALVVNQKKQLASILNQQQQQGVPSIQAQNIQSPGSHNRQSSGRTQVGLDSLNLSSPLPLQSQETSGYADSHKSVASTSSTLNNTNSNSNNNAKTSKTTTSSNIPHAPSLPAPKKPAVVTTSNNTSNKPVTRKVTKSRPKREDLEHATQVEAHTPAPTKPSRSILTVERPLPSKTLRQTRVSEQMSPFESVIAQNITTSETIHEHDVIEQQGQVEEQEKELAQYRAKETKERVDNHIKKEEENLLQRQVTLLTSLLKSLLQGSVDGSSKEEARLIASEQKDSNADSDQKETAQVLEQIAAIYDSAVGDNLNDIREEHLSPSASASLHSLSRKNSLTSHASSILSPPSIHQSLSSTRRSSMVMVGDIMMPHSRQMTAVTVGTNTDEHPEDIHSMVHEQNSAQDTQHDVVGKLILEIQQLQAVLETVQVEREKLRQQLNIPMSRKETKRVLEAVQSEEIGVQTDPMLVLETVSDDIVTCYDDQNMLFGRDYVDVVKAPMTPKQMVRVLERTNAGTSTFTTPKNNRKKLVIGEFHGTKVYSVEEGDDDEDSTRTITDVNSVTSNNTNMNHTIPTIIQGDTESSVETGVYLEEPLYSRIFTQSQLVSGSVERVEQLGEATDAMLLLAELEEGTECSDQQVDLPSDMVVSVPTDKDGLSGKNAALLSAYTSQLQYLLKRRDEALKIATTEAYEWKDRYFGLIEQLKTAKKRIQKDVLVSPVLDTVKAPDVSTNALAKSSNMNHTSQKALYDLAAWIGGMELGGGGGIEDKEHTDTMTMKVIGVYNPSDLETAKKMVIPTMAGVTDVPSIQNVGVVPLQVAVVENVGEVTVATLQNSVHTVTHTPDTDRMGDIIVDEVEEDTHSLGTTESSTGSHSSPILSPRRPRPGQLMKLNVPNLPSTVREEFSLDSPTGEDRETDMQLMRQAQQEQLQHDLTREMTQDEAASMTSVSLNLTHEYKGFQSDWIPKKDGLLDG